MMELNTIDIWYLIIWCVQRCIGWVRVMMIGGTLVDVYYSMLC